MSNIPVGTYNAIFDEYENDYASTDGSEVVKMTFVLDGNPGEQASQNGRKAYRTFSMKATALWAFKRACLALGESPETFESEEDLDTDEILDQLVGSRCRLVVKHRKVDGELRSDVRAILAPAYEFADA